MMERKSSSVGAVYDRSSFPLMSEKRAVIDRAYRRTPWLLLLLLSISAAAQQQQTPFTLKVSTQLVIQAVTVTDKDGKTLSGLTAEDFTLTEDNNPQTISVFEFQKIDDTATPRPLSTPPQQFASVLQPAITKITPVPDGDTRYQDRRLLALYFDMSALNEIDRFRALTAAQAFIEKEMKGPDLVALFTYGNGSVRVRRDFTDDRAALEESLQRLLNPKDTDALEDTVADFGQNSGEFNLFNTDRQLAALQTTVNMLGVLKEKKSLIYFASGLNLNGVDNQAQLRATLNAARRANVAFYPVDARGLVATAPMGNASQRSPGGLGMYTGATAMSSLRVLQRSQDALYTLAADTGGKALLDSNDLSAGIVRAQQAASSYYILGYYSTNTNRDGKLRRVKITLKDRSADLSYRESYYAEKDFSKYSVAEKERQLEEALMLGDPITELTIVMELNYFRLNNAEYFVPLAVKIPGNELVLAQKEGAERTIIDFIGEIKDESGVTMTNLRDKVEIKLKGEAAGRLASSPVQYDAGFTLFPGKYTIKFLARNAETGRIGTYQANLIVPNLNKELTRLPTSSVVLSSQRVAMTDALFNAGKTKEAREQATNPLIEDGQKLIPSVTRVFSRSRDLYIYLQAYERDAATMHPLAAVVTLLKGEEIVFESPAFTVTEGMDPKSKAVPFKLTLPLESVAPDDYVFQISIIDPTAQKAAFWQAPVKIVP
ncbi:MAG TPA: VWA domain-containing protein [Terriglobia bacterium]|nr:VWA domain-containing protein [Terriglobia bacterium]